MHLPTNNAEVLLAIFGTLTPDALPFVTGFPGHPKDTTNKATRTTKPIVQMPLRALRPKAGSSNNG